MTCWTLLSGSSPAERAVNERADGLHRRRRYRYTGDAGEIPRTRGVSRGGGGKRPAGARQPARRDAGIGHPARSDDAGHGWVGVPPPPGPGSAPAVHPDHRGVGSGPRPPRAGLGRRVSLEAGGHGRAARAREPVLRGDLTQGFARPLDPRALGLAFFCIPSVLVTIAAASPLRFNRCRRSASNAVNRRSIWYTSFLNCPVLSGRTRAVQYPR